MVTIILAIAVLIAVAGLAVEIGIASWNIRRAGRYQRREIAAEHTADQAVNQRQEIVGRLESLDEYVSKISWLLNFLYKRYDKFSDLENEVDNGLMNTGEIPVGEAEEKYKDLQKALKIIRVTVKASERVGNLVESIASQVGQIMEDFKKEEDKNSKAGKPSETTAKETPNSESAE